MTSNEQNWVFGDDDAQVGVLLEPREGHTADEVAQAARDHGATDVVVLSADVVSAKGTRQSFETMAAIATVNPKPTNQMRRLR